MCTCINFKTKDFYFGRNLDLEYNFGERVVITPRKYKIDLKSENNFETKYAFIGMATVEGKYPLYADAVNEKGLCMAGLYFPGNAVYNEEKDNSINIASFELIPWCLGNFSSLAELRKNLENLNITNYKFNEKMPVADLHWMICDKDDCVVLEQTKNGLQIYDNPYGVLTNNPPFNSILAIEVSSQNAYYLEEYANRVRDYFVSLGIKEIEIIGPSILRRNKFKFWKYIFIKYKKLADVIEDIESLIDIYKSESKFRLKLNFNPYAF